MTKHAAVARLRNYLRALLIWIRILKARKRQSRIEGAVEHRFGPERIACCADDVVVVCVVRNGSPYIDSFVRHYKALGVRHIAFLDNGSDDDTLRKLEQHNGISVLQCNLPFRVHKEAFRRYLADRYANQSWCLAVDIDEFFEYPLMNQLTLGGLVQYLADRGFTAVVAHMLDLLPATLDFSDEAEVAEATNFREHHRYFDVSSIDKRPYRIFENDLADASFRLHFGGVRKDLFLLADILLTKHPLYFNDGRIHYRSSHIVNGAWCADITAVLLHYKFVGDFKARVDTAISRRSHYKNSSEYRYYRKTLESKQRIALSATCRAYGRTSDLVDCGFLTQSKEYASYVARQSLVVQASP